ncbi:DUF438 domain-containing protein [Limosilactobacillus sp. STM2_1]|uniref:DUF438 domain-containing protein n=1 Tax=Limosilactobacillus rudii TaxID=2759755 RepID=A0A7W3UMH4_9LACO|nr:DUF438 domain-containing protein [Limosilactobacillus rudii]MBB1078898.1 DUF438 domain-containing protein [Limosilactobacillus rudii]MBB1098226.1 DUF438 domain-containing protein [Limosilactobacillus rudii]MCD7135659.1 DUF438 domain-containing protein [Limosilactobacillus rudii]
MTTNARQRQRAITKILTFLHQGGDFEEAKKMFNDQFSNVDVAEITAAERELIANGLNPIEIQNLCNVHAAVFKGAITNNQQTPAFEKPGHPVNTLKLENKIISSLINDELLPVEKKWQQDGTNPNYLKRMQQALSDLKTIDKHYARKENTIFPLMDKYGITAPPKVMWGVDDNIRQWIDQAYQLVHQEPLPDKYQIEAAIEKAAKEVLEMIFKEEDIMLPMLDEVATPQDWKTVRDDEDEIGYTLIPTPLPWSPTKAEIEEAKDKPRNSKIARELNQFAQQLAKDDAQVNDNPQQVPTPHQKDLQATNEATFPKKLLDLGTGNLEIKQLIAIFQTLPVDLTFVDHTDHVRWFSDNQHRIFPRTKSVIGRAVVNCHPPKSVDKVQQILHNFHSGKSNHAEFWIDLHGERFIHIEYFALHDPDGQYLGCLEVSQDATHIRSLTGEKRL